MSGNVESREVRAIPDPPQVAPRDFRKPLRLSPKELESIRRHVQRSLRALERRLQPTLREENRLDLVGVVEISATGLFSDLSLPIAMVRFAVDGQPGWVVWEVPRAIQAIEVVLGAAEAAEEVERELSPVEKKILTRLLSTVVQEIAGGLGLSPTDWAVVDLLETVGDWRDGGETADPQRLEISLDMVGPRGGSTVRVYLPGVRGRRSAAASAEPAPDEAEVPEHLAELPMEIRARLGSTQVPLGELLELEVGDVVPLGVRADEPLRLLLESRTWATARLGSKAGMLAVQVEELAQSGQDD